MKRRQADSSRAETYREGIQRIAAKECSAILEHGKSCYDVWPEPCDPCIARETLEKGELK